jgi:biopolymer transport protein ExbD
MSKLRGKYHTRPQVEMNMTPLIDVMLVLLMILMLSAPVLANQLPINLPVDAPPRNPPPVVVHVRVAADGRVTWDGASLTPDALHAQIAYEASRDPQSVIELDADDATPYETVVALAARLDAAGIDALGFRPIH